MSFSLPSLLRRRARNFLVQPPRAMQRMFRWVQSGNLEKRLGCAVVGAGDIVIDVGAGQGELTWLLSEQVSSAGEVHAFEPLPPIFSRLRAEAERRGLMNRLFLNNTACMAHTCEIPLQAPLDSASGHGELSSEFQMLPVQAIRLDDYNRGRVQEKVDFVVCMVQGADLQVLHGMTSILARFAPLILVRLLAAWTKPFGYAPSDLVVFLESLGYDSFYLLADRIIPVADAQATVSFATSRTAASMLCGRNELRADRLLRLDKL